ncbi:hypothetical protein QOT17_005389 [Balamuthia mandrillaris]
MSKTHGWENASLSYANSGTRATMNDYDHSETRTEITGERALPHSQPLFSVQHGTKPVGLNVWAIVAERKDTLSLQLDLLLPLLTNGLLDQLHLWNYIHCHSKDEISNKKSLSFLQEARKRNSRVHLKEPLGCSWAHFYEHYALEARPEDVIIKADNGILWFNSSHVLSFINRRRDHPEALLISANVVNNDLCAFYQQQNGAIPFAVGVFEHPSTNGNEQKATLSVEPERALALHKRFLANKQAFAQPEVGLVRFRSRLNVHLVAFLGKDMKKIAEFVQENHEEDEDEDAILTRHANELLEERAIEYIDMAFTAAHATYRAQESHRSSIVQLYQQHR